MEPLKDHTIEFTGLKDGQHEFQFVLDQPFFDASAEEEWQGGQVTVDVTLDKSTTLLVTHLKANGTVRVHCDRCDGPLESTRLISNHSHSMVAGGLLLTS